MRKVSYILAFASSATCAFPTPLPAGDELSMGIVLEMMSRIPPEAHPSGKPAGYDKSGDARAVAAAIAATAGTRAVAARMAVYSSYESSNVPNARGDCDAGGVCRSLGAWQLRNVPPEVANDPMQAARVWLGLAKDAEARCALNPPEERLAVLASGSCSRARAKVRRRAETARRVELATTPALEVSSSP